MHHNKLRIDGLLVSSWQLWLLLFSVPSFSETVLFNTFTEGTPSAPGNCNTYGFSVSNEGDLNGDGFADLIISDESIDAGRGKAYIYFGSREMDNTADITLIGEYDYNSFGMSVSNAGDLNKDGFDDAIIGASQYGNFTGRAYIYFGGNPMDDQPDVILTGPVSSGFGYSVSDAGDVNGDGYDDIVVGASPIDQAFIYFGGLTMDNAADVFLSSGSSNTNFGYSVSAAGDINKDGFSDVMVSAHSYNNSTGRVYVYYGGTTMNNTADVILDGDQASSYFGHSVSAAGDINKDGYDDLIIGAPYSNSRTGRAYIYYGGLTINGAADLILEGENVNDYFAYRVANAGDINNDGYADIMVSTHHYNLGAGRVYVYFGGQDMNTVADIILDGEEPASLFGFSISGAGDINHDGRIELLVGASGYQCNGKAYLFGDDAPVSIALQSFTANADKKQIALRWKMENKVNCAGFNVYRSHQPDGDYLKINECLIASTSSGCDYEFIDLPPTYGFLYYKLEIINLDGFSSFSDSISVLFENAIDGHALPLHFSLQPNYPNPFNPATTIRFDLPVSADVNLQIFDAQGNLIRTLINETKPAGTHQIIWNGSNEQGRYAANGIYFCRLNAAGQNLIGKMTLLK